MKPLACGLAMAIIVLVGAPARAERPPLKAYTTADGLAHDSVNKIVRDSRGFLWFCTAEGLSRFDGYRFKSYTQDQGLPHRNVNDLLETKAGVYLVATSAGVSVFNPRGKPYRWNVLQSRLEHAGADVPLFQTFRPPSDGRSITNLVTSLAEDGRGRIWAGTGFGLFQFVPTGEGWTFREFVPDEWAPGLGISALIVDAAGQLVVASGLGVFRIGLGDTATPLLNGSVGAISLDRSSRLWVDAGLELQRFAYDSGGPLRHLDSYSQKDGLPTNALHFFVQETSNGRIYVGFEYGFAEFVTDAKPHEPRFRVLEREKINALAEDAAGALWIGTDNKGVWKLARAGLTMFGERDGLSPTDELMSVFSDRAGEVYVASRPNKLSHLASGRFETVTPFGLAQRSWGWHFLDLQSRDGEWWIPGADGLRRYPRVSRFADLARTAPTRVWTKADGLLGNEVFVQFEDSRGDIWFTLIAVENSLVRWERRTGRLVAYTTADGLPRFNGPMSFGEDSHGNVWFGYYFGGLARYRNGSFRLFTERDGLPISRINDLLTDSRGRLWIATSGRGLLYLDDTNAEAPTFHGLSTADGLSSNQPLCLAEDRFGRVYVGTGRGINRIERSGAIRIFAEQDGLPGNHITRCTVDARGDLWFITRNTLLRFVPEPDRPAAPPTVLIDRILVNGVAEEISELGEAEPQALELRSTERQVEVDFFALASDGAQNLRYQYRLDSQNWSAPTADQILHLDLSPGTRTLSVRAITSNGLASRQPASVRLTVVPPVWLRWWFIGLVVSAVGLAVSGLNRYRMARLREVNAALAEARRAEEALGRSRDERLGELERVRTRIATDLHDDIGSSLTQIAVLSEVARRSGDNGAQPIERVITISNELVETMSDIVWAINPKKDHLSDLLQRMRRFASDILTAKQVGFTFGAPGSDRDVSLGANIRREVFLIFKECIHNVVRHSDCTHVDIAFGLDEDNLVLSVCDNGKGFDAAGSPSTVSRSAARGGNGLASMRRRADEMGGRLDIVSRPGAGATATLRLALPRPPTEAR
jgi:signal transduction histidine kinase/ligand-binding sensor domain-containing protein